MHSRLLVGFAALLLSACAGSSYSRVSLPPQEVQVSSPTIARVYVLRGQQVVGSLRRVRVYEDERELGAIDDKHFLCWERAPGASLLEFVYEGPMIEGGDVQGLLELVCKAGQVYYLRIDIDSSSTHPTAQPISPEEAREALKRLEPAPES